MRKLLGKAYVKDDGSGYYPYSIKVVTGFCANGRAKTQDLGMAFEDIKKANDYCNWYNKQYFDQTEDGCQCFTCRNSDNEDMIFGYYMGQIEVMLSGLRVFKELKIKCGKLEEKTPEGEYACLRWNLQETLALCGELVKKMYRGNIIRRHNKDNFKELYKNAIKELENKG